MVTEDELKAIEAKLEITIFPWDGEGRRTLLPSDVAALIAEIRRLREGVSRISSKAARWMMLCYDGCYPTFYESEDSAFKHASSHWTMGHRIVLAAPGTYEIPQGVFVGVTTEADKEL